MKLWLPIPQLIFSFLTLFALSGCVTELMEQEPGLAGDLFREESNRMLPPDIQILIDLEDDRYEEMNYIDNANFSTLRSYCQMPEAQFNKLLLLRWELFRLYHQNDILVEQTKVLYKKVAERATRKSVQTLCANYQKIRDRHDEFMEKSGILLAETKPYRPWLYHRLIIMKSDKDFHTTCETL